MRVIAIEHREAWYQHLMEVMRPYTDQQPSFVYVRKGTLEEKLDGILKHVAANPVLFFLDPFDIGGLSAQVLERALNGPSNELLLLFHDEGAVRLGGKATAVPPDAEAAIADVHAAGSLFGEQDVADRVEQIRQDIKRCLAGHASNPRAKQILDRAYGSNERWQPRIDAAPADQKQRLAREIYEEVLLDSGAKRVLPFSVDTESGLRPSRANQRAEVAVTSTKPAAMRYAYVSSRRSSLGTKTIVASRPRVSRTRYALTRS
jgi:hypothetical protein